MIDEIVKNTRTGLWVMLASVVAGILASPSSTRGEKPPSRDRKGPELSPDHVSAVIESRLLLDGERTTQVVLDNRRVIDSDRSLRDWAARLGWPALTLSVVDGKRRVLVRPGAIVSISESNWRRSDSFRRDTLVVTLGTSLVVRESVDEVREICG